MGQTWKPLLSIILILSCESLAFAFNVERNVVPVSVHTNNDNWVQTISICNMSGQSVPLTDLEFQFNYAIKMPNKIWGQPLAAWRVASQNGSAVILLGGAPLTLPPDPECKHQIQIQFNAAPDAPQPTGPFLFKAGDFIDYPNSEFGNGTWVYDMTYDSSGKRTGEQPGLFAADINRYNQNAQNGHKLTQIFSYGGDMEMYCRGSGGTSADTPCTAETMQVYYIPQSTAAYDDAARAAGNSVAMHPIVDGVIGGEYLTTFNALTQNEAEIYADSVATLYCADNRIEGVQFDLEPFDISMPGQAYFFAQIAKNFAGLHNGPGAADPYHCVNETHPHGRTFSVFTFSQRINAKLAEIFNRYHNGVVIISLYDLGAKAGGIVNSVSDYTTYVNNEIANTVSRTKIFNVNYQFGIPAAASVHEFESVNGQRTGYLQIDYIKAAINAINLQQVRNDKLFKGINLWGWNQRMFWGGKEFTPSIPNAETLNYLSTAL